MLFGAGLVIGGFLKRSKVIALLTLDNDWDPTLLFGMMLPVLVCSFSFWYILEVHKKNTVDDQPIVLYKDLIDYNLLIGAILLGVSWGLSGLCILPAMALAPIFTPHISLIFFFSMGAGVLIGMKVDGSINNVTFS